MTQINTDTSYNHHGTECVAFYVPKIKGTDIEVKITDINDQKTIADRTVRVQPDTRKRMTIEEIEKELGYKVEVLND